MKFYRLLEYSKHSDNSNSRIAMSTPLLHSLLKYGAMNPQDETNFSRWRNATESKAFARAQSFERSNAIR